MSPNFKYLSLKITKLMGRGQIDPLTLLISWGTLYRVKLRKIFLNLFILKFVGWLNSCKCHVLTISVLQIFFCSLIKDDNEKVHLGNWILLLYGAFCSFSRMIIILLVMHRPLKKSYILSYTPFVNYTLNLYIDDTANLL